MMTRHKIIVPAALLTLVYTAGSRAQTAAYGTAAPSGTAQVQAQKVPVMVTWEYNAETKMLLIQATNNSGKDIVAYFISVRRTLANGALNDQGHTGQFMDSLPTLVRIRMAEDPDAYERWLNESGNGLFVAGTTRDTRMEKSDNSGVEVRADVAFYADGSFDKQDEDEFKVMLSRRQGQLQEMKKADQIMQDALAYPTNEHPAATAIPLLAKAAAEAMAHTPEGRFDPESEEVGFWQGDITNMRTMQRMAAQRLGPPSQKVKTERERLAQFVEDREKQVELMTPHCHLEIALKQ
jgi:hypothetical protein